MGGLERHAVRVHVPVWRTYVESMPLLSRGLVLLHYKLGVFKTTHIDYLSVSVGQESRPVLAVSSALGLRGCSRGVLLGCILIWRVDWGLKQQKFISYSSGVLISKVKYQQGSFHAEAFPLVCIPRCVLA